jgi:hypothetical protein
VCGCGRVGAGLRTGSSGYVWTCGRALLPGRRCETKKITSKIGFGHLGGDIKKLFWNPESWEISGFLIPVTK